MARDDLALLASLDVLLAERSVTRAARRLGLSQPAMSTQLARLRDRFDDPLLVPSGREMVPTARAEALREPLHAALREIEMLVARGRPFDPATSERTFRIAASDAIHSAVTAPFAARLRSIAPNCRVAMLGYRPETLDEMTRGQVDLLLGAGRSLPLTLKARTLYDETFLCVLRADHPAASRPLTLDAFCALDHVLVSPGGADEFEGAVDAALHELGRSRRVSVALSSFLLVPTVLAGSDLVATVPARLARGWSRHLAVYDPPLPVPGFTVRMGWHVRADADPGLVWLRHQISGAAAGQGQPVWRPAPEPGEPRHPGRGDARPG